MSKYENEQKFGFESEELCLSCPIKAFSYGQKT